MHALEKYLARVAEADAHVATGIQETYERALVVPACREDPALLDGFTGAAGTSRGRTLCILVVNGPVDATPEQSSENRAFLADILGTLERTRPVSEAPNAWLGEKSNELTVLVVDRASEGAELPRKSGVGLARKIGTDIAVALHAAGKVRSPLIFATDADASLPEGHFERTESLPSSVGAVVFPFWHEPAEDPAVTRATAEYELSLRYYVAGLGFAGSPYAFHTLGSAMAVGVQAYAAVRGFPRRVAGEDFYLLGKLAKVAPLVRAAPPAVRIRSRRSDRTPFGTGARIERDLRDEQVRFYSPRCFVALGRWLGRLDVFAADPAMAELRKDHAGLSPEEWDAVHETLFEDGGAGLKAALGQGKAGVDRRVRAHEWFDAFRTLKLVHALRDRVHSSVSLDEALATAPFAPQHGGNVDVDVARRAFADREATAAVFGPRALASVSGR